MLSSESDLYQAVESLVCHEMMFALMSQLTGTELHPQANSLLSLQPQEQDGPDETMPETEDMSMHNR